jgi:hypothetical protein
MAQLLEAPVLEEPPVVPVPVVLVEVELAELLVVLLLEDDVESLLELELEDSLELSFLALPPLLYRSAYQPPPLRMKPAPPDTWRLAVAWWH